MADSVKNPLSIGLQTASSLGGAVLGMIGAKQQRDFESAEAQKERLWNEAMMNKENAFSLDMWNRTNEYNSPAQQVARLREAGLNPLYYGLDGSSANGFQSAEALGYDRASANAFENPLSAGLKGAVSGLDAFNSARSAQKDIELKNAQIDKIKSDTVGVGLDNEFKDKTMQARVQAEELKNSLTREQVKNFEKQRDVMEADIQKRLAETKTELERAALTEAEKILKQSEAKEIIALLPLKENLLLAQTDAQRAAASASWANAAYTNKLINEGYVDALISKAKEEARRAGYDADSAEVNKMLLQYKQSIQNGTVFAVNDLQDGKTTAVSRAMDFVAGKVVQAINITATALGTGISPASLGTVSSSNNTSSGTTISSSSSSSVSSKN